MSNIRLRSLISAFFLQCLLICCDQVAVPEREVSLQIYSVFVGEGDLQTFRHTTQ